MLWPTELSRQIWLRGRDLNPRPPGYEPDELPDCSTPRRQRLFYHIHSGLSMALSCKFTNHILLTFSHGSSSSVRETFSSLPPTFSAFEPCHELPSRNLRGKGRSGMQEVHSLCKQRRQPSRAFFAAPVPVFTSFREFSYNPYCFFDPVVVLYLLLTV